MAAKATKARNAVSDCSNLRAGFYVIVPVFVVIDRMCDHDKYFLFLTIRNYAKGA